VSTVLLAAIRLFISSMDFISLIMMSYEFHVRNNFYDGAFVQENKLSMTNLRKDIFKFIIKI